jgi:hypothetical protein
MRLCTEQPGGALVKADPYRKSSTTAIGTQIGTRRISITCEKLVRLTGTILILQRFCRPAGISRDGLLHPYAVS